MLLAAVAFGVLKMADDPTTKVATQELLADDQAGETRPVDAVGEAHPVFARLPGANMVLPVAAGDATIIAYHPLSDDRAVALSPVGTQVNGGVVARSLERVFSGDQGVRYYILDSKQRVVAETGAVDIGAAAGTAILSPVKGQVTGVKPYKLYGKHDDVQVDIRPAGVSGVTISLLFVEEPAVAIGQTVEAGKTQIGTVRRVAEELSEGLSALTHDAGNHVHIQVTQDSPDVTS